MSYYEQLLAKNSIKLKDEQVTARNSIARSLYIPRAIEFTDEQLRQPERTLKEYRTRPSGSDYTLKGKPRKRDAPRKQVFTEDGQRICCVCYEAKPADQYFKRANAIDGRDARCKDCKREIARQRWLLKKALKTEEEAGDQAVSAGLLS